MRAMTMSARSDPHVGQSAPTVLSGSLRSTREVATKSSGHSQQQSSTKGRHDKTKSRACRADYQNGAPASDGRCDIEEL
jgi:hypothetical protein